MGTENLDQLDQFLKLFKATSLISLAISVTLLIFVIKAIEKVSKKVQDTFPGHRLLTLQLTTILSFFLYIGGGLFLFYSILQPPKELLLAVGGSAAVAIGFSLKDLVGSVIAGVMVLFERPFQVGDRVKFGGVYGDIMSIGLRATRLRTLDDSLVTVPNSRFFTDLVSSGNSGALDMMIEVPFHISIHADVERARDLLYEAVVTSRFAFLRKPVKIVLSEEEVAGRIVIKMVVKAYVLDVSLEKAFQTDLVSRVSKVFRDEKVARPTYSWETAAENSNPKRATTESHG